MYKLWPLHVVTPVHLNWEEIFLEQLLADFKHMFSTEVLHHCCDSTEQLITTPHCLSFGKKELCVWGQSWSWPCPQPTWKLLLLVTKLIKVFTFTECLSSHDLLIWLPRILIASMLQRCVKDACIFVNDVHAYTKIQTCRQTTVTVVCVHSTSTGSGLTLTGVHKNLGEGGECFMWLRPDPDFDPSCITILTFHTHTHTHTHTCYACACTTHLMLLWELFCWCCISILPSFQVREILLFIFIISSDHWIMRYVCDI